MPFFGFSPAAGRCGAQPVTTSTTATAKGDARRRRKCYTVRRSTIAKAAFLLFLSSIAYRSRAVAETSVAFLRLAPFTPPLPINRKSSSWLSDLPGILPEDLCNASEDECWEEARLLEQLPRPYVSSLLKEMCPEELDTFLGGMEPESVVDGMDGQSVDPLWEQVKLEARSAMELEPQAGPQLCSLTNSDSLLGAISDIIANEIQTELMPATSLTNLFLEQLHPVIDHRSVSLDVSAAAVRSPSVGSALNAILFDRGLHALVCYRVGHRLWLAGRKGLAYYMQSTVSSKFSADLHPSCRMGDGVFLNCAAGVVVGETAVVGDETTILQGVTLGGTGKEAGDRHPKVGRGVILHNSATVLGNISVGDGAVVTAKSIVTKPVPPLARVSGVPAKIIGYRSIGELFTYPDEGAHAAAAGAAGGEASRALQPPEEGGREEELVMALAEEGPLERRLRLLYLRQWESFTK